MPSETETGWLIERGSPAEYLSMHGRDADDERRVSGEPYWSDHNHAIRFARRVDAVRMLGILRDLLAKLPYRDGLDGLRPNDPPPRVCDHQWCYGPAAPSEETTNG